MPWRSSSCRESGLKALLIDGSNREVLTNVVLRVGTAYNHGAWSSIKFSKFDGDVFDRVASWFGDLIFGPKQMARELLPIAACESYIDDPVAHVDGWALGSKTWNLPGGVRGSSKIYTVEVKPLFSAFYPMAFSLTLIRCALTSFLGALEGQQPSADSDDENDEVTPPREPFDVNKAVQITIQRVAFEVSIMTTRRVLERLIVHYCNARTAWKLLKDSSKSATRKSKHLESTRQLFSRMTTTGFRAHIVVVSSAWIVQSTVDTYTFLSRVLPPPSDAATGADKSRQDDEGLPSDNNDDPRVVWDRELAVLLRKQTETTLKAVGCLSGAAVGAGLGSVMRPGFGTYIGIMLGDALGAYVAQDLIKRNWASSTDDLD